MTSQDQTEKNRTGDDVRVVAAMPEAWIIGERLKGIVEPLCRLLSTLLAAVFKHVAQDSIEVMSSGRREDEATAHAFRLVGDEAEAMLPVAV